jgi:hypothetical protein
MLTPTDVSHIWMKYETLPCKVNVCNTLNDYVDNI